jgi:hypothetical protein
MDWEGGRRRDPSLTSSPPGHTRASPNTGASAAVGCPRQTTARRAQAPPRQSFGTARPTPTLAGWEATWSHPLAGETCPDRRASLDAGGSVAYVRTDASPNEVLQHNRLNAPTAAPVNYLHNEEILPSQCHRVTPGRHARRVSDSITAGRNRARRPVPSAATTRGNSCACASSPRLPCTQVTPRTRCVGGCDRRGTGALPELHG